MSGNMNNHILRAPIELISRVGKESQSAEYRNDFMRDRDRIMYSSAFRRLDGKTQIYLTGKNDHRRNRLTHTLEVAQIARTISQALGLNVDLTEAIALGHDLGHTPFGHAGERMLNEIMSPQNMVKIPESPFFKDNGNYWDNPYECKETKLESQIYGFKHNMQSIRVVSTLETGYGNYGLNLTNYTLWGMLHHSNLQYKKSAGTCAIQSPNYYKQYDSAMSVKGGHQAWSFEAFVVAQADEIAQWHHDLEDAYRSHALSGKSVCNIIKDTLGTIMSESDKSNLQCMEKMFTAPHSEYYDRAKFVALASKVVVNSLVSRIVDYSSQNLMTIVGDNHLNENNRIDFFKQKTGNEDRIKMAIGFDAFKDIEDGSQKNTVKKKLEEFPRAIQTEIHHSPEVERMNEKGCYIIRKLFQAYSTHPQQLPDISIKQFMIETHEKNEKSGYNYVTAESASVISPGNIRSDFDVFWQSDDSKDFFVRASMTRKICDHIASMTDHYAISEYENLYG